MNKNRLFTLQEQKGRGLSPLLYVPVAVLLIAADQLTKLWALHSLGGARSIPVIGRYIQLSYTPNSGAAFSMLQNQRIFLIAVPVLFTAVCLYFLFTKRLGSALGDCSLALIAAGGIGNLIDRVFRGYVVDFIDCTGMHFAVFNVADSCVTVGVVLLVLYVVLQERGSEGKRRSGSFTRRGH